MLVCAPGTEPPDWYWELNLGYPEEELSVISLALGRQNWWICELKVIPVHTASSRPARAP